MHFSYRQRARLIIIVAVGVFWFKFLPVASPLGLAALALAEPSATPGCSTIAECLPPHTPDADMLTPNFIPIIVNDITPTPTATHTATPSATPMPAALKGIGMIAVGHDPCAEAVDLNLAWFYTWGVYPKTCPTLSVESVPMIWGRCAYDRLIGNATCTPTRTPTATFTRTSTPTPTPGTPSSTPTWGSDYLMGFNEPDLCGPDSACITPAVAGEMWATLEAWVTVQRPNTTLVSPALINTWAGGAPIVHDDWWDEFYAGYAAAMATAGTPGATPQFGVLAVHCHVFLQAAISGARAVEYCKNEVMEAKHFAATHHITEIWVTEYSFKVDCPNLARCSSALRTSATNALLEFTFWLQQGGPPTPGPSPTPTAGPPPAGPAPLPLDQVRVSRYAWFANRTTDTNGSYRSSLRQCAYTPVPVRDSQLPSAPQAYDNDSLIRCLPPPAPSATVTSNFTFLGEAYATVMPQGVITARPPAETPRP